MLGSSSIAAQLAASQEGFSSVNVRPDGSFDWKGMREYAGEISSMKAYVAKDDFLLC
jgi:hypothetical protein